MSDKISELVAPRSHAHSPSTKPQERKFMICATTYKPIQVGAPTIFLLPCVMVYYTVLFLMFFWCPYIVINVNVQDNGGVLPDTILLTR